MLANALFTVLTATTLSLSAYAHPGHDHPSPFSSFSLFVDRSEQGSSTQVPSTSAPFSASKFPAIQSILEGNNRFIQTTRNATLMADLVENGQKPPVMMVSCSDSRAPEATIFDSQPGTFFMERNIANQYKPGDENAQSVMAYGIHVLGVQHVVIMGHYGCGGIAASIASAPKPPISVASHIVQTWIGDVRSLYLSSDRAEIVEMRTRNLAVEASGGTVPEPEVRDPGFRALVEENVKIQVARIAQSSVIRNLNEDVERNLNSDGTPRSSSPSEENAEGGEEETPLIPVFVHGWVHDLETGEVIDLNISTGPAGFENFTPSSSSESASTPEEPTATTTSATESSPTPEIISTPVSQPESEAPVVESDPNPPTLAAPVIETPATAETDVRIHGIGSIDAPTNAKLRVRKRMVAKPQWSRSRS